MKNFIALILTAFAALLLLGYCESKKDPYEEGTHLDYSIRCESGFVYKTYSGGRGTIQVLNTDGTPLKCGAKHY